MDQNLPVQLGLGGAVVMVLWWVVSRFIAALERTHTEFVTFLGNHMSKNTVAMQNVVVSMEGLSKEISTLREAALGERPKRVRSVGSR